MIDWQRLDTSLAEYREQFSTSKPFRYVVMENFLEPEFTKLIEGGFEIALSHKDHTTTKSHRNVLKKTGTPNLNVMTAEQVEFFNQINSERFIAYLSALTDIMPVLADHELKGGGLHSSVAGGFLNIHTDFNFHPKDDTHRRLNLIFYVNSEWKDEWEGGLELWNNDVSACEAKIFPKFNRAVLFETSEISFHGHPIPLACPEGVSRKSIAVYYYSKWPEGLERREKTNYILTPSQKDVLRQRVREAIDAGAENFEAASALIPDFQPAHVKRIFAEVKNGSR
ncbi:2OG-Fe(II) oxygenase [Sphingobium phenoxybenzoativorans]|uniref:2OG-Fe(II) oxygenase n=1 Tax=Sphingobium phenoxybenzoativorans TaxID=1592790 RepID=UPI0009F479D0|nr:2OG-Fe(II) oxygenase [Sphingobium phenoxybenzoativorans]